MTQLKRWYRSQSRKAWYYSKKLLSLKLVKILLIFLFVMAAFPVVVFLVLKPQVQPDINYGVTFSDKYATQIGQDWQATYLKILDDLGIDNLRLVAYWDDIEKVQDQYDFSNITWQLDEAAKRDVSVILIIGRKTVRYPECFEPAWWHEIESRVAQEQELFEYVKASVKQLRKYDNIVMWQVENEPFWPFGECDPKVKWDVLNREVEIVRNLDSRPILIQDSGEGGVWLPSYLAGDNLAISMYRRIWYDFWGLILGRPVYFKYPLAYWTYKIKAGLVGVPYEKILVTELQAEPWGPRINSELSRDEINKTMSRDKFIDTISYAQKAGFKDLYFWGVEWWLFEKEQRNEPFYWDTIKALVN